MKKLAFVLPAILLPFYLYSFILQERVFGNRNDNISALPEAKVICIAAGYLKQVVVEFSFIRTAVYLGSRINLIDADLFGPVLAHNYKQMATVYPYFTDTYYFAQAFLPHLSHQLATTVNEILSEGEKAYKNEYTFPFYKGVNCFTYLDAPLEASKIFENASRLENAPTIFKHLAIILAAEGGQLEASILSLHVLLNNPDNDEGVKNRYREDLEMYQSALRIKEATRRYFEDQGKYPDDLTSLVPKYIDQIPSFGNAFVLTWAPPNVGLKRPRL